MRKLVIALFLLFSIFLHIRWHTDTEVYAANKPLRAWLQSEIAKAQQALLHSCQKWGDRYTLQQAYHKSRKHYKHVEFFVEYCSPREAKSFINGALVPKSDLELSSEVIPPQGYQRIEELLFNDEVPDSATLREEYRLLISRLEEIRNYYEHLEIQDGQLLEMCQVQLFRIAAMNLSGYDATLVQTNVIESYWCMEGMEEVMKKFSPYLKEHPALNGSYKSVLYELNRTKKYLRKHTDYNTFPRLEFILNYITPLNRELIHFHNLSKLPWSNRIQALNLKNEFLFGKESFNTQYFSMYYDDTVNIQLQARLGKTLFFDPILSGDNKNACATCHNASKAFTDGYSKGLDFDKQNMLLRNTPTLLNVIYQKAFFYDGRAYQLEQQIFDVVHNKNEMHSNFSDVIHKLKNNTRYRTLFQEAFKGTPDSSITSYAIQKAIMEYEKTLISLNSRFDKYLHGDTKKLTTAEINGYNLFAGKALCGSCHFFPLFNGTVPPFYNDSEYEVIGVPTDSANRQLDEDIGRYAVTALKEQLNAFKTPTVRNVELTAPYMHNGIYTTLEEVVEFYHKGGGTGLKLSVPNQTLPFDSLLLSPQEKNDIVAFLKTLTDTVGLSSSPHITAKLEQDKK